MHKKMLCLLSIVSMHTPTVVVHVLIFHSDRFSNHIISKNLPCISKISPYLNKINSAF